MADIVFNIAKGRVAEKVADGGTYKILLLKSSGLEADGTLADHDTVAAVLAAANDECDFTNYVRKTLASLTVTVDDTNNRVDVDAADVTWTTAGGASNNTTGKAVIFHDVDGTDANAVPLVALDLVTTTDASDLLVQFASAGWFRAS